MTNVRNLLFLGTAAWSGGDASVNVALDFLAERSSTSITSAAKDGTVKAERAERQLLQPSRLNAVQREVPGLF